MNKEKLLYEAPTALTFVVKVQGMICQSPGVNALNHTEYFLSGYDDDYEEL